MKVLFASDLDKTLIHFQRSDIPMGGLVETERTSHGFSVMSASAYNNLRYIQEETLFVPTTTRSMKQYGRIKQFKENPPKYAVLCNGGKIFTNGTYLSEWDDYVAERSKSCSTKEEVFATFERHFRSELLPEMQFTDDLFWYLKLVETADVSLFQDLVMEDIRKLGWVPYVQGKKVFALPAHIDKGEAIRFLIDKENINFTIAAGDSTMDDTLLKVADLGIVPAHGEIRSLPHSTQYKCTVQSGIYATDEILEIVKSAIKNA